MSRLPVLTPYMQCASANLDPTERLVTCSDFGRVEHRVGRQRRSRREVHRLPVSSVGRHAARAGGAHASLCAQKNKTGGRQAGRHRTESKSLYRRRKQKRDILVWLARPLSKLKAPGVHHVTEIVSPPRVSVSVFVSMSVCFPMFGGAPVLLLDPHSAADLASSCASEPFQLCLRTRVRRRLRT